MRTIALLALAIAARAAVIGTSTAALPLTVERIAALTRAQRAEWQAYLDRSLQQRTQDRAALAREMKEAGLTEALVPPSGSAARSIPLNQPAEWYATTEARRIADIVVSFQTPAGGWSKNLNLADHVRRSGEHFAPDNRSRFLAAGDFDAPHDTGWNYVGTLDNDATITEMRFLAKIVASGGGDRYRASFDHGVEYLLAAQFPNGGWPQVWPLEGGYHDAVTFNDGAMTAALELLQSVAAGEYPFVPSTIRERARKSVDRGIACILAAQVIVNGRRTVWGQQHDQLTLKPAAGRNYEPAAVCSSESAGILRFLMTIAKPSPNLITAVEAGIAWVQQTAIRDKAYVRGPNGRELVAAPGGETIWARFYEIGSNRPVFGDRDKTIHDDVAEISRERRDGYSWYTSAPREILERYASWKIAR